ncbi:MAG: ATP-binding protein [Pseudomonadota bacterium]
MYRKKLIAFAIASALVVVAAALGAVWSSRVTLTQMAQVNVANALLAEHLEVSSMSYRLFKQLTDEILFGEGANQAKVRNKRALISESLERIRILEQQQRAALGLESTRGTIEDTDDLKAQIDAIIEGFENAMPGATSEADRLNQVRFILEERIDIAFREAINTAVERQSGVVQALNGRINNIQQLIFWASLALGAVAVILILLGVSWLIRAVSAPVNALIRAADAISHDDLSHRVPRGFDVEFDQIAAAFNQMAKDLATRNMEREQAQERLEYLVAQRTAELTDANSALERSDVVRRNFLADVSHELRTPLTIIRGEAQVALRQENRDSSEYREALRSVLEQSVSLSHLVDDLLFVARADTDSLRIDRHSVDLVGLVADVERDLAKLAMEKGIEISTSAPTSLDVIADPERLRQLLVILVDNAIRYSANDTHVSISAQRSEEDVVVEVQDQGHGIDAKDLPFVFERFYRGSGSTDGVGMGLGLTVARAIVEAHGGEIMADSEVGKGTTIQVKLPMVGLT